MRFARETHSYTVATGDPRGHCNFPIKDAFIQLKINK